nr:MAG TPA: hypothetical protein [Inoviridae sp.]
MPGVFFCREHRFRNAETPICHVTDGGFDAAEVGVRPPRPVLQYGPCRAGQIKNRLQCMHL